MRKLIIAIDCDDVLVPTLEATVVAYNKTYGTTLELKDFYGAATLETWGTDSEEEAVRRVTEYLSGEEFSSVKPFPDAIEAVAKLATHHELHLVTGRSDDLEHVTRATLETYFPGCFTTIEHTNYFHGHKKRSKGEVCAALGADVLIDDHVDHGQSVLDHGVKEVIVFGSYPWNLDKQLSDRMTRCLNWTEVMTEIERISHE